MSKIKMTTSTIAAACLLVLQLGARAHAAVQPLPPNAKFDYQIGGAYTPASDVRVVTRDRLDDPVDGLYNVCYINAFQTQPEDKSFWLNDPVRAQLVLRNKDGSLFEDEDWPGEYFLDTSTAAKRDAIMDVLGDWINGCAENGFQAIEPDNLDTYTRSNKLLTRANNLALAQLIVASGHTAGLAVAQKNTAELNAPGVFDFAVAEECQEFDECDSYTDMYGGAVLEIEYNQKQFNAACSARGSDISVIFRDVDVVPKGDKGYKYSEC